MSNRAEQRRNKRRAKKAAKRKNKALTIKQAHQMVREITGKSWEEVGEDARANNPFASGEKAVFQAKLAQADPSTIGKTKFVIALQANFAVAHEDTQMDAAFAMGIHMNLADEIKKHLPSLEVLGHPGNMYPGDNYCLLNKEDYANLVRQTLDSNVFKFEKRFGLTKKVQSQIALNVPLEQGVIHGLLYMNHDIVRQFDEVAAV